jgi:hypothetical protein
MRKLKQKKDIAVIPSPFVQLFGQSIVVGFSLARFVSSLGRIQSILPDE